MALMHNDINVIQQKRLDSLLSKIKNELSPTKYNNEHKIHGKKPHIFDKTEDAIEFYKELCSINDVKIDTV